MKTFSRIDGFEIVAAGNPKNKERLVFLPQTFVKKMEVWNKEPVSTLAIFLEKEELDLTEVTIISFDETEKGVSFVYSDNGEETVTLMLELNNDKPIVKVISKVIEKLYEVENLGNPGVRINLVSYKSAEELDAPAHIQKLILINPDKEPINE